MARTGQAALHDTVATRRRRFVGHILRLLTTRPASLDGDQKVAGGSEDQRGHGKKGDLDTRGVDWIDARDTANDRARWR